MKNYNFKINGHDYEVVVNRISDGVASVSVNGEGYEVAIEGSSARAGQTPRVSSAASTVAQASTGASASTAASAGGSGVKSPLPGVILDVKVREGDRVAAGQTLAVLEAMKMENNIDSPSSGTVVRILKRQGDSVLEGDILLTIE